MFKVFKLKENEEILLIVRQSSIAFSGSLLLGLLLFLLPFFLLFPLFSWGTIGMVIFFMLLVVAIIFALYRFVDWYFNCGIITSQRVIDIDQNGLFDRTISEVPYYKIDDVSHTIKGIRQSMFKFGNVAVAIRGYRSSVTLQNISKPWMVQELILQVERQVRGWDKEVRHPMDNVMSEMDNLSDVEKKSLEVALRKMRKTGTVTKKKVKKPRIDDEIYG